MSKKKLFIKLSYKKYLIATIILIVLTSIFIVNSLKKTYINSEYGYSFQFPKSAQINFISSYTGTTDISKADTISVIFKTGKTLRIQAVSSTPPHPSLCTTEIQRTSDTICFSSPNTQNPLEEKDFRYLIKTFQNFSNYQ